MAYLLEEVIICGYTSPSSSSMHSPVVLGLQEAELLLDPVDALPDGELEGGGLLTLGRKHSAPGEIQKHAWGLLARAALAT